MKHRLLILTSVVVIALTISCVAVWRRRVNVHLANDKVANSIIKLQNPIAITKVIVLSGHEFDVHLDDGRHINAILEVTTGPDAKKRVLDFLNRCKNPRAVLDKKVGSKWVVRFYVTAKNPAGEEVELSLSTWLQSENLVYQ